jgi:hypothetical protein
VRNLGKAGKLERVEPIFLLLRLWRAVFSLACALKMKLMRGWSLGRPAVEREKALRRGKPMRVAVL